jgi:hypothetical protein
MVVGSLQRYGKNASRDADTRPVPERNQAKKGPYRCKTDVPRLRLIVSLLFQTFQKA